MADLDRARSEQFVPYSQHVAHWAVLLDDGSVLGGFRVAGIPWETGDPDDTNSYMLRLAHTLRLHVGPRVTITTHVVRTLASAEEYPEAQFTAPFAQDLYDRHRTHLTDRRLYRNELFMFVQVKPTLLPGAGVLRSVLDWVNGADEDDDAETLDQLLRRLDDLLRGLESELAQYDVERLGTRREGRVLFSEIGEALYRVLTTRRRKVPVVTGRLARGIYCDRVIFGWEALELRGLPDSLYAAGFVLFEYPSVTWPGMFGNLLSAPYSFVLTQSFGGMTKSRSQARIGRKQSQMRSGGDKALSQVEELTHAADDVASGRLTLGDNHVTLFAFAETMRALRNVAAQASSDFADCGAVVSHAHLELAGSYWAQLPGNMRFAPRPGVISNLNFAAMSALHNYPRGARVGRWGNSPCGPIAVFRTNGGTAYRYHIQHEGVSNTFISGPTRSGKTTLMLYLLVCSLAQGAQVLFWDKDRGGEIAVRAVGGSYMILPVGEPSGCAPLKALTGRGEDIAFLSALIRGLIAGDSTYEITAEDDRKIDQALTILMRAPPEERSLGEIRAFLGVTDPEGAGARLERWCAGHELGWVLDNEQDEVRLDAGMIGFDMTGVLDNADVRGPLMGYLFYRACSLVDGRRLIFCVDEFWKALLDPAFRDVVHNSLKTWQKMNVPVILGTQSPRDALNSPIAHTIIEQCTNQIHMPNGKAREEDYIVGLHLTQAEFDAVKGNMGSGGRGKFLLKQGSTSVICELDLSHSPDHVAVLSGRKETVNLLTRLRAELGDNPAAWLPHFYREWRNAS